MPEKNTLETFKPWLLERQTELLTDIIVAREAAVAAAAVTGIDATDVNDLEDQASKRERTTLQDAEEQRDRDELADVQAALARFTEGSYGTCINCAQPIDFPRLEAIPAAARCLACQRQWEASRVPEAKASWI